MEIGHQVLCGPRHGDGVTAARVDVVAQEQRARAVVGTDARETGDRGEDHRRRRLGLEGVLAPAIAAATVAGFEDDSGAARALAFEVEPAAADVDKAGEGPLGGGPCRRTHALGRNRRRGDEDKGEDPAGGRAEHAGPGWPAGECVGPRAHDCLLPFRSAFSPAALPGGVMGRTCLERPPTRRRTRKSRRPTPWLRPGAPGPTARWATGPPASLSQPKLALRHSTAGRRAPTLVTGLHPASRPRPARPTPCTTW